MAASGTTTRVVRSSGASAALAALAIAGCGGGGDDAGGGTGRVEAIDFAGGVEAPRVVAVGDGRAWFGARVVLPVAARTHKQEAPIPTPAPVAGLAYGEGGLWTALGDGTIVSIDPKTRKPGFRAPVGPAPEGGDPVEIAAGRGGVWVAVEDSIVRVDPALGFAKGKPIRVDGTIEGVAAGEGGVWVAVGVGTRRVPQRVQFTKKGSILPKGQELEVDKAKDSRLVRIDPATNKVADDIKVKAGARDVALQGATLWLSTDEGLQRFDAGTGRALGGPVKPSGTVPLKIATGPGSVWATISGGNDVVRVDSRTLKVAKRYTLPSSVNEAVSAETSDLAVGAGGAWIASKIGPRAGVVPLR